MLETKLDAKNRHSLKRARTKVIMKLESPCYDVKKILQDKTDDE